MDRKRLKAKLWIGGNAVQLIAFAAGAMAGVGITQMDVPIEPAPPVAWFGASIGAFLVSEAFRKFYIPDVDAFVAVHSEEDER